MSQDQDREPNRGWFRKGKSGNPGGRPKRPQANSKSAFDVIVDKTLTVSRSGAPREITVEEALQLRTYKDALSGKRIVIRGIVRWIEKRQQWLAKKAASRKQRSIFETLREPDNADAAMLLLGIAKEDPSRIGQKDFRLRLEPWAVAAGLKRR